MSALLTTDDLAAGRQLTQLPSATLDARKLEQARPEATGAGLPVRTAHRRAVAPLAA